ncbi:phosphoribosylaminoimidazole carboxylase ATPase subunit [compost metagenome]
MPDSEKVLSIADCHLHHYGKAFKVGRKVGHANLRCADRATLAQQIIKVETLIAEQ